MNKRPLVSVLLPTYNYAQFLPEAIESILAQDHSDFELLISDDASSDESASLIRSFAERDSRVRVHLHEKNLGMVQNWNWCLNQAKGKYIKYLFGDDRFGATHTLRRLTDMLEGNSGAVIAASARKVINERSEPLTVWNDIKQDGLHGGHDLARRCLLQSRNLIGEPSADLFRAESTRRPFDFRYRQIVDLEMWCYLLKTGDLVYTSEELCHFRFHRAQQTEANRKLCLGNREQLFLLRESVPTYLPADRFLTHAERRDLFATLFHVRRGREPCPDLQLIAETLMPLLGNKWYMTYWMQYRITKPFKNLRHAWRKHVLKTPCL